MKTIQIIFFFVFVSACSNEQIYTTIQDSRRLECSQLPQQQYEDCMKEHETTYDEYEQDRQDLEKEQAK